jgi:hypothetical protein
MNEELDGQLPLFTLDGADEWIQRHYADEDEYTDDCRCYLCEEYAQNSKLGARYRYKDRPS